MLPIQILSFVSRKNFSNEGDFIQITIKPGAYEIESLNIEIRRLSIDGEHYTESDNYISNQSKFFNTGIYYKNITTRTDNQFCV